MRWPGSIAGSDCASSEDTTSSAWPASRISRGFTDADDRDQPCPQRGGGLFGHQGAGFTMLGAALGMADDHIGCAEIGQHFCGDVAGESTFDSLVAVLRASFYSRAMGKIAYHGYQRKRRAEHDIGAARLRAGKDLHHQGRGGCPCPVHLPIADDQFCMGPF